VQAADALQAAVNMQRAERAALSQAVDAMDAAMTSAVDAKDAVLAAALDATATALRTEAAKQAKEVGALPVSHVTLLVKSFDFA